METGVMEKWKFIIVTRVNKHISPKTLINIV